MVGSTPVNSCATAVFVNYPSNACTTRCRNIVLLCAKVRNHFGRIKILALRKKKEKKIAIKKIPTHSTHLRRS